MSEDSSSHLRVALTVTHLFLVALGSINLIVILLILLKPYLRSITNVYMVGLCLADFIYLTDLTLVAATSMNDKSWPFGHAICIAYHGTETTGKYASVLFVVLLAADRYVAMCCSDLCSKYRNYRTAITLSALAWLTAFVCSLPLYYYATEVSSIVRGKNGSEIVIEKRKTVCRVDWPSQRIPKLYIAACSVAIFIIPVLAIFFFYYNVFCKLREAAKGSRRLHRRKSRSSYQRVTRSVQRVVLFHLLCWTPFWLFNLFTSIYRISSSTQFLRICLNIIHLFPYINCALNPLLYAYRAENFRVAFKSLLFMGCRSVSFNLSEDIRTSTTRSTYFRNSSNVDSMKSPLALVRKNHHCHCPDEGASIYMAEEESLAIDTTGGCVDLKELDRRKAELLNWRPYDGSNVDGLQIDQSQSQLHKSSARSVIMPAITVLQTNGDKGTVL